VAVLRFAAVILLAGCYAPEAPDCAIACTANSDCITSQACTTNHLCAAAGVTCGALAIADGRVATDADEGPGVTAIKLGVSGAGSVRASTGDQCANPAKAPIVCSFQAPSGQELTLTATPSPSSTFKAWTGACTGQALICHTTPTGAMITVNAKFE
jgi:hypothetical protein